MLAVLAFVLASDLRAAGAEPDAGADETLRYSTVRFQSLVAERDVLRPWQGTAQQAMFVGSGFLLRWDEEGPLVCTNAHVINDASAVVMQVPSLSQQQFAVKVVLVNHDMDIAIVRLMDAESVLTFKTVISEDQFTPVQLYTGPATVGMEVHAMGFPLGVDSLKLTTGVISGSQVIGGFLSYQTTAPISPGNSGGPLFIAGTNKVVGINYASLEAPGAQQNNFVVPSWRVAQMVAAVDADSQDAEPVFGQYRKAACAESREMCTLKIPPLAAEILPGTSAMYEHYGCEKGVFASKVHEHSLLHTADPPIPSKTFITKINDVELDSYGQGRDGRYTNLPVDFFDLAFMGDGVEEATVETCTCGQTQTHKVQLRWQAGNEAPVPYIDEPTFATMDFEQFGDLTMAPLTLNAAKALMQNGAMQLVSYVADPAGATRQLVVTDVASGGEASQSLEAGAIVHKVNGVAASTLEDLRANFHPTGTIACAAQEHIQMQKVEDNSEDSSNVLFKVLQSDVSNGWMLETKDGDVLTEDFRITLVVQAHKIRSGEAPITKGVQGALMNFAEELKAAEAGSSTMAAAEKATAEDLEDLDTTTTTTTEDTATSTTTADLLGMPETTDPGLGELDTAYEKAAVSKAAPRTAAAVHAAFAQTTAHQRPIEARVGARRGGARWSPF